MHEPIGDDACRRGAYDLGDTFFELIRGEIIEMADPTGPHIGRVNKLNRLFTSVLGERVVLNIPENVLEVRTDPADGQYRRTEIFKPGQTVSPQELPGVTFAVDDILK